MSDNLESALMQDSSNTIRHSTTCNYGKSVQTFLFSLPSKKSKYPISSTSSNPTISSTRQPFPRGLNLDKTITGLWKTQSDEAASRTPISTPPSPGQFVIGRRMLLSQPSIPVLVTPTKNSPQTHDGIRTKSPAIASMTIKTDISMRSMPLSMTVTRWTTSITAHTLPAS
ncbi:MAG: hypothetical protein M2R45_04209 [Verrucomicrobia subdivision 3 bacterium]|nr:hypothetical protein [Limisphaerales bacterium]MCS1417054.1 hypothetical protein [Limisphaerales bacterium]